MRLIDADNLIVELEHEWKHADALIGTGFMIAALFTKRAPTIEPEDLRPTGVWVVQDEGRTRFACSACGIRNVSWQTQYCPHCGARMDLEVG